ncbi:MAG: hypothetical protein ABS69_08110 [Nitrosomonadales bacterium SCN 54-20]|nr:MAG: hypothetical protein ABS69_08110 [Nitrosomonadales bacterium SCN 54-20]
MKQTAEKHELQFQILTLISCTFISQAAVPGMHLWRNFYYLRSHSIYPLHKRMILDYNMQVFLH